jgi:hypothetical protein
MSFRSLIKKTNKQKNIEVKKSMMAAKNIESYEYKKEQSKNRSLKRLNGFNNSELMIIEQSAESRLELFKKKSNNQTFEVITKSDKVMAVIFNAAALAAFAASTYIFITDKTSTGNFFSTLGATCSSVVFFGEKLINPIVHNQIKKIYKNYYNSQTAKFQGLIEAINNKEQWR